MGSTPTALPCAAIPGVTEVRPGTYVYNDAMQIQYGLCSEEAVSYTHLDVYKRQGHRRALTVWRPSDEGISA